MKTRRKKSKNGEGFNYFETVVSLYEGDECLIWPYGCGADGYGLVRVDQKIKRVPRLSCEVENGPPPTDGKYDAAHSCGNGHLGCCSRKHLRWATRLENVHDAINSKTHAHGETNGQAKLTEADVREIRKFPRTVKNRPIAEIYGLSARSIWGIRSGETWKHIAIE